MHMRTGCGNLDKNNGPQLLPSDITTFVYKMKTLDVISINADYDELNVFVLKQLLTWVNVYSNLPNVHVETKFLKHSVDQVLSK